KSLALQDTARINTDLAIRVEKVAAVARQATGHCEAAELIDRGESVMQRQRAQLFGLTAKQRLSASEDHSVGVHVRCSLEGLVEIALVARLQDMKLQAESTGGGLGVV